MTTLSSTLYEPGAVVAVRVQFTARDGVKRRPAVVISCRGYHRSKADAVIVPLTTQMSSAYFGDYDLVDWTSAGLPKACRAKGVIETIERAMIENVYGALSTQDLDGIKASVRRILEL